ncbi:MAG: hypothetical protein DWQ37_07400 [Planctomycetota bacterium]|nr:MAG: hypothetical protein DWQ37_07400 [Planctomycetota bacterium]
MVTVAVLLVGQSHCRAADEIEQPPIQYSQSTPENRVSKLAVQLAAGESRLEYDQRVGYLAALLEALDVPIESQMLVFSKTSLQRHRISPRTPRAIYFSDDVYVGYCRSGDVLEISAVDPQLGAVFYTLDQKDTGQVQLSRQTDNCLLCHSSSRTEGVPGHLARSMFVDSSGQPIFSAGSYSVDHTTPLEQRWGGWYVTGTHGNQRHLGNMIVRGRKVEGDVDNTKGQNVVELSDRLSLDTYLAPHSDIVALMVLEHQTLVHNCITKANYTARQALLYEREMNRALGEPPGHRFDSTSRRIQSAGDDLVEALLFVDEAKLTGAIRGTSGYAEKFTGLGPHDSQGRSLRDFDLEKRLFKYPCSYVIYSQAFDALPREMLDYVWQRLWDVLVQQSDEVQFAHLSNEDRQAIVDILRATKPELPDYWREAKDSATQAEPD